MFSLAIEPVARGDEQRISAALEKLNEEDPCFKVTRETQTKELVVSGLGDLHLRIMLEKLEKRFKLTVTHQRHRRSPIARQLPPKPMVIIAIRSRPAELDNSAKFTFVSSRLSAIPIRPCSIAGIFLAPQYPGSMSLPCSRASTM